MAKILYVDPNQGSQRIATSSLRKHKVVPVSSVTWADTAIANAVEPFDLAIILETVQKPGDGHELARRISQTCAATKVMVLYTISPDYRLTDIYYYDWFWWKVQDIPQTVEDVLRP